MNHIPLFLHCLFFLHCPYETMNDNGRILDRGCADCGIQYSVRVKFFWRDFWIGFYLADDEPKLVICLLPTLPIIIEWRRDVSHSTEN